MSSSTVHSTRTDAPFDDLYEHLSMVRSGGHLARMTRYLLNHVSACVELIGIDVTGRGAIYHDASICAVYVIPFSVRGLHVAQRLVWPRAADDPNSWIESYRTCLAWVNPALSST